MAVLDYKPIRWFGTWRNYYTADEIDPRTICLVKETGQVIQNGVDYGQGLPVIYAYTGHNIINVGVFEKHLKVWTACVVETSDGARHVGAFYSKGGADATVRWMNELGEMMESVKTDNEQGEVWTERTMALVLREGESSSALYDQLATIAGNDVESVAVQYISADGNMWRGTWYPVQGLLDVHAVGGVYRLEFDDVVAGMADATFIETAVESVLYAGLGMKDYHIEHNLSLLNGWKSETPSVMSKRCVVYEVNEQIKFDGVVFPEAMTVRLHKAQGDSDYAIPESGAIVL